MPTSRPPIEAGCVIKFCGLTNLDDTLAAVQAGATWLGFNFYPPSPRYLSPDACAALLAQARPLFPPGVLTVGVFVNLPTPEVEAILAHCGLDLAQLSGDESLQDVRALGERAFKVVRARPGQSLADAAALQPQRAAPPAVLLDASVPGLYGGSGQTADWAAAASLAAQMPVLLAGGLTPDNVAAACQQVRPWGVDVASGIEQSPGRKDPARMAAFVRAVRGA